MEPGGPESPRPRKTLTSAQMQRATKHRMLRAPPQAPFLPSPRPARTSGWQICLSAQTRPTGSQVVIRVSGSRAVRVRGWGSPGEPLRASLHKWPRAGDGADGGAGGSQTGKTASHSSSTARPPGSSPRLCRREIPNLGSVNASGNVDRKDGRSWLYGGGSKAAALMVEVMSFQGCRGSDGEGSEAAALMAEAPSLQL